MLREKEVGSGWIRARPVEAIASNTTTLVGAVQEGALVQAVEVEPRVVTPNGDGVNDEMGFHFQVVKVGDG